MNARNSNTPRMAFVGFGEAAAAFVKGFGAHGTGMASAFDIKSLDPAQAQDMEARYAASGVRGCAEAADALGGAQLVLSLVTADQVLAAAEASAPFLQAGPLWVDGNSCAPDTKRAAAVAVTAAGGRYVDMAIMAPVHPKLHRTPVLLAGPDADAAAGVLSGFGMDITIVGNEVGQASAIKMIRSVMIKGMEALCAECFLAARRAGVDGAVIASLTATDPGVDWTRRGAYNFERMMVHGTRRAAEMEEAAGTLRRLGLPDRVASATALWEAEIGALGLDPGPDDFGARADLILRAMP